MSNLAIAVIVAEALFLCVVVLAVWVLILRHRIRRYKEQLHENKDKLSQYHQRIIELERWLSAAENARKPTPKSANSGSERTVRQLRERINNLEKFKKLYFKMEEKQFSANKQQNKDQTDIEESVSAQSSAISDLKGQLDKARKENEHLDNLGGDLYESVLRLESINNDLEKKLAHTKRQRALAEKEVEELRRFREEFKELESRESRLKAALHDKDEEISTLKWDRPTNKFGTVRIKEIEDLSSKLHQRDAEVKRLRQECEIIGKQYEDLAAKSLALASVNDDLSDEKKQELEQLKQQLKDNAEALALKQAECDMLESYYLELEGGSKKVSESDYQRSLEDKEELESERDQLYELVAPIVDKSVADDLVQIKSGLQDKSSELEKVKQDYMDIKQQFIEIAQEEVSLRTENHELRSLCDSLQEEINEFKRKEDSASEQKEELEKLREEYNKLESRYLSLIERY